MVLALGTLGSSGIGRGGHSGDSACGAYDESDMGVDCGFADVVMGLGYT